MSNSNDKKLETPGPTETHPETETRRRRGFGLSSKLLLLTVAFVMIGEILIFVPSIANFRTNWLANKLATARVASVAISTTDEVPMSLEATLVRLTGALALAIQNDDRRRMIFRTSGLVPPDYEVRLGDMRPFNAIVESFETLFNGDRVMRVIDRPIDGEVALEMIVREDALRDAMLTFGRNILLLSLIISVLTATLVYLSLRWMFVRPMVRMSKNMQAFSDNPENTAHIITPSARRDEIGEAETRLRDMQHQLSKTLNQQRRLADLGLAVSKINHDLRNILASAQLFSDRLSNLPDPTVQRFAPKLIASLDRAIGYTRSVLSYSRPQEAPPERRTFDLHKLVDEVGDVLGLGFNETVRWENRIRPGTLAHADPDQLFRVVMNLCRNSVQALEAEASASKEPADPPHCIEVGSAVADRTLMILISDNGPGVPERARENLFKAFQGSVRPGGTGLGLPIAAELVRAHGGTIALEEKDGGAHFRITLPDAAVAKQANEPNAKPDARTDTGPETGPDAGPDDGSGSGRQQTATV